MTPSTSFSYPHYGKALVYEYACKNLGFDKGTLMNSGAEAIDTA